MYVCMLEGRVLVNNQIGRKTAARTIGVWRERRLARRMAWLAGWPKVRGDLSQERAANASLLRLSAFRLPSFYLCPALSLALILHAMATID